MTIITKKGNLLDAKGIIVHGCNCQGVMGSGVALAIKNKWPDVYQQYRDSYELKSPLMNLGQIIPVVVAPDTYVLNAITQKNYGRDGARYVSYDAVTSCFEKVRGWAEHFRQAESRNVSVNFPLLGAGLGGGDWEIISKIIDRTLGDDIEKILWVQ